jgi:hypothetical protein
LLPQRRGRDRLRRHCDQDDERDGDQLDHFFLQVSFSLFLPLFPFFEQEIRDNG